MVQILVTMATMLPWIQLTDAFFAGGGVVTMTGAGLVGVDLLEFVLWGFLLPLNVSIFRFASSSSVFILYIDQKIEQKHKRVLVSSNSN